MGFKTVKNYNDEKFGGLFMLRNDGDYADVIFMYQNVDDVLVADTHYIKSAEYSGYVHCCGAGCPACSKGIRVQTKLFIPLYNIDANEIQFFDRTMRFEPQLNQDVFSKFPNPSEFVFRITRHGAAGSIDTTYEITAIGKNTVMSYSQILADKNATFPDYYKNVCKELSAGELHNMLSMPVDSMSSASAMPSYQVTPRSVSTSYASTPAAAIAAPNPVSVSLPEMSSAELDDDLDSVNF